MVGLNHATAPVRVREQAFPFECTRDEMYPNLGAVLDPALFSEYLVLATCNRTEIYAVTTDPARGTAGLGGAIKLRSAFHAAAHAYLYQAVDCEAIEHLFAVACGIDSLVLGEFEILGQVRDAYQTASARQSIGPILHQLFQAAIRVGKRAHSETEIGRGAQSVAYAAVTLAREKSDSLRGQRALVIGAGEMGRRAAENLAKDTDYDVVITSRTYAHASVLAERIDARAVPFQDLPGALAHADLVIGATRAPHLILYAREIERIMQARPAQPLCLIDIAVPRNIDPEAAAIPQVQLYNIDDLQHVVDETRLARLQAVAQVRGIIAQEIESFWQWYLTRRAAPLIRELYARAETIRQAELTKTMHRLSHLELGEREVNVIAALSAGLVSKLLAGPTANLKEHMQDGDGQLYLQAVRELFDLPPMAGSENQ